MGLPTVTSVSPLPLVPAPALRIAVAIAAIMIAREVLTFTSAPPIESMLFPSRHDERPGRTLYFEREFGTGPTVRGGRLFQFPGGKCVHFPPRGSTVML